jgi:hypothetical protein
LFFVFKKHIDKRLRLLTVALDPGSARSLGREDNQKLTALPMPYGYYH